MSTIVLLYSYNFFVNKTRLQNDKDAKCFSKPVQFLHRRMRDASLRWKTDKYNDEYAISLVVKLPSRN